MEDKVLQRLVEDELAFQPAVDAAHVGVSADGGIVHLTGRVASFREKVAIETAVKRVKGVRGYVEDLAVQPHGDVHSDDAIAAQAANLLEWDTAVPKGAVKVKVEQGVVTLSGDVEWGYQRAAAETGLRRLDGVRGVCNLVMVKPRVSAHDIKTCIRDALARQAQVDANRLTITVQGSTVRLDGEVHALFERGIIERAAWAAPGVTAVEDHITVS
jgi:osmotically-inducible protein OsmY